MNVGVHSKKFAKRANIQKYVCFLSLVVRNNVLNFKYLMTNMYKHSF